MQVVDGNGNRVGASKFTSFVAGQRLCLAIGIQGDLETVAVGTLDRCDGKRGIL